MFIAFFADESNPHHSLWQLADCLEWQHIGRVVWYNKEETLIDWKYELEETLRFIKEDWHKTWYRKEFCVLQ